MSISSTRSYVSSEHNVTRDNARARGRIGYSAPGVNLGQDASIDLERDGQTSITTLSSVLVVRNAFQGRGLPL